MSLMNDFDRNSEEVKKNLKTFGSRIQELRRKNNLTQSELAEKIGISTNFIRMIERGEKNTTIENVFKIARALNVKFSNLFEEL